MGYELPTSVEIDGLEFAIRTDFRVILDIFAALDDSELNDQERAFAVLQMFYPDFDELVNYDAAIKELFKFINGGTEDVDQRRRPKLVDWQQDSQYIIAPINHVIGTEIRAIPYDMETNTGGLHWWTFLAAYTEIGDCLFAQIVRIRDQKARGKKLDKSDQEFYKKNREIVDIKRRYTPEEDEFIKKWTGR